MKPWLNRLVLACMTLSVALAPTPTAWSAGEKPEPKPLTPEEIILIFNTPNPEASGVQAWFIKMAALKREGKLNPEVEQAFEKLWFRRLHPFLNRFFINPRIFADPRLLDGSNLASDYHSYMQAQFSELRDPRLPYDPSSILLEDFRRNHLQGPVALSRARPEAEAERMARNVTATKYAAAGTDVRQIALAADMALLNEARTREKNLERIAALLARAKSPARRQRLEALREKLEAAGDSPLTGNQVMRDYFRAKAKLELEDIPRRAEQRRFSFWIDAWIDRIQRLQSQNAGWEWLNKGQGVRTRGLFARHVLRRKSKFTVFDPSFSGARISILDGKSPPVDLRMDELLEARWETVVDPDFDIQSVAPHEKASLGLNRRKTPKSSISAEPYKKAKLPDDFNVRPELHPSRHRFAYPERITLKDGRVFYINGLEGRVVRSDLAQSLELGDPIRRFLEEHGHRQQLYADTLGWLQGLRKKVDDQERYLIRKKRGRTSVKAFEAAQKSIAHTIAKELNEFHELRHPDLPEAGGPRINFTDVLELRGGILSKTAKLSVLEALEFSGYHVHPTYWQIRDAMAAVDGKSSVATFQKKSGWFRRQWAKLRDGVHGIHRAAWRHKVATLSLLVLQGLALDFTQSYLRNEPVTSTIDSLAYHSGWVGEGTRERAFFSGRQYGDPELAREYYRRIVQGDTPVGWKPENEKLFDLIQDAMKSRNLEHDVYMLTISNWNPKVQDLTVVKAGKASSQFVQGLQFGEFTVQERVSGAASEIQREIDKLDNATGGSDGLTDEVKLGISSAEAQAEDAKKILFTIEPLNGKRVEEMPRIFRLGWDLKQPEISTRESWTPGFRLLGEVSSRWVGSSFFMPNPVGYRTFDPPKLIDPTGAYSKYSLQFHYGNLRLEGPGNQSGRIPYSVTFESGPATTAAEAFARTGASTVRLPPAIVRAQAAEELRLKGFRAAADAIDQLPKDATLADLGVALRDSAFYTYSPQKQSRTRLYFNRSLKRGREALDALADFLQSDGCLYYQCNGAARLIETVDLMFEDWSKAVGDGRYKAKGKVMSVLLRAPNEAVLRGNGRHAIYAVDLEGGTAFVDSTPLRMDPNSSIPQQNPSEVSAEEARKALNEKVRKINEFFSKKLEKHFPLAAISPRPVFEGIGSEGDEGSEPLRDSPKGTTAAVTSREKEAVQPLGSDVEQRIARMRAKWDEIARLPSLHEVRPGMLASTPVETAARLAQIFESWALGQVSTAEARRGLGLSTGGAELLEAGVVDQRARSMRLLETYSKSRTRAGGPGRFEFMRDPALALKLRQFFDEALDQIHALESRPGVVRAACVGRVLEK